MLELDEQDLNVKGSGKTGKRYAHTKVSEFDPFYAVERSNWTKAEIAGVVEYLKRQPEFVDVFEANGENLLKTVESMLANSEKFQKEAVINARQLSWQTQLMAGKVASPKFFRSELGRWLGMFKRFQFGQVENIVRSFQQSGTNGISALRILARGFPDEVQHVEQLRAVEMLRKGLEEVEKIARESPESVDISASTVSKMRKMILSAEVEFNDVVSRLNPINKNNIGSQAALWARYAAKRWAYAFLFNTIAGTALDVVGINVSDDLKDKDPIERAIWSATRNLIPFFYDAKSPNHLFATPLLPDTGPFSGGRQYLKGMIEWGFNITPGAGLVNRLSNRFASNWIIDQIMPKKEDGGTLRM
jgi:hypothetical protein